MTLAATAAAWALPFYEQMTGSPRGNVTELWQVFLHQTRAGQSLGVAVSAWSDMLVGTIRPDFYVAHGWPFAESPVRWAEWVAPGELAAVVVWLVGGLRRGDRFAASLGSLLIVAASVALWSATRIEERVFDHDVFWMVGLGVLSLAVTADALGFLWIAAKPLQFIRRSPAWLLCAPFLFLAATVVVTTMQVHAGAHQSLGPSADARPARAPLADDRVEYMRLERLERPLVKIDQDAWVIAAGAILDLQKRGRLVSVEEGWVVMFTPEFRINGRENAVITVAMPPEHLRLAEFGVPVV